MHVRSRGIKEHLQASDDSDFKMADTQAMHTGNKIADINMQNGIPYEKEHKIVSNKVRDISKSPSITSQDSCTKLTLDKDADDTCCARESSAWIVLKLAICFACGIIFGIMFVYSRGKFKL